MLPKSYHVGKVKEIHKMKCLKADAGNLSHRLQTVTDIVAEADTLGSTYL